MNFKGKMLILFSIYIIGGILLTAVAWWINWPEKKEPYIYYKPEPIKKEKVRFLKIDSDILKAYINGK